MSNDNDIEFEPETEFSNSSMSNKWISVEDSLPEDNCQKLVYDKGVCVIADYWTLTRQWLTADPRVGFDYRPTHWMPLPSPPKEQDNG